MNKKPGTSKDSADRLVRGIKRKTRKHYSSEEKIRIVLAGLRGEESIAALCRREGIAESLFEDRGANPPSIADLCKVANVGATTLHLCFNEVYGVSPIAYLQAKRITQARCAILDAERAPRSVKDVALSLGFTHSGRFAKRYHKLFGELPSETLNKR